jgi:signal transduction histidine kinase
MKFATRRASTLNRVTSRATAGRSPAPAPPGRALRVLPGPRPKPELSNLALWTLVAALYFAAGKLGLMLAYVHPSASSVWPPSGIVLACILALGPRAWPGVLVGGFLVNFTTLVGTNFNTLVGAFRVDYVTVAISIATSLGIAVGNTLEGLVGAALVRRFANGLAPFERAPDTFRFAFLAGMLSTAIGATIGVASLRLGGFVSPESVNRVWVTWWLGDLGGDLMIAPLLLLWIRDPRLRWTRMQAVEGLLLLTSLIAVGWLVFGGTLPLHANDYSLAFVCTPLLIWAAFRFDQKVASAAIAVLAVIAVWGTLRGLMPVERWQRNESLLLLQLFLAVSSVTTLALAAEVADRKRAEQALRARSAELRAAVADLETFSHAVSHDLRSPIGAVVNFAAILEEDCRDRLRPGELELLRRIRAGSDAAARLVDQLVQFAWNGTNEKAQGDVDMSQLAHEAFAEVAAGSEGTGGVRLHVLDLPPVRGSAELLGRVFRNLFSNAVKYSRGRTDRRIEVSGSPGDRENVYCVSDNGIGFDPAFGEAVFQPFRRLNEARRFEGTGLGLAITARIIRRQGGRIWAESDGTTGSRFWFTVPIGGRDV